MWVKCGVPNFLMKAAIDDPECAAPSHRKVTRRGRPVYGPTYAPNGSILDRIERRAGHTAVTELVLVMLVVCFELVTDEEAKYQRCLPDLVRQPSNHGKILLGYI